MYLLKKNKVNKIENVDDYIPNSNVSKTFFKKNVCNSNINFLFGAGVNGKLFPNTFDNEMIDGIKNILNQFPNNEKIFPYNKKISLEDNLTNFVDFQKDNKKFLKNDYEQKIIDFFRKKNDEVIIKIDNYLKQDIEEKKKTNITTILCGDSEKSFKDFREMIESIYYVIDISENRNKSTKEINIFTLNYDTIIDKILSAQFIENKIYDNFNITSRVRQLNTLPYDFEKNRITPQINVFKLHGNIENNSIVIPSIDKYLQLSNNSYYQLNLTFEKKISRQNSILFIIGYSFRDEHINTLMADCINNGMTIINIQYNKNKENILDECFEKFMKNPNINKFSKSLKYIISDFETNSTKHLSNIIKKYVVSYE